MNAVTNISAPVNTLLSAEEIHGVVGNTPCATGLPNRAYTSAAFFDWERENIFKPTWFCIANTCAVPLPGDIKPLRFMDTPLVLVHDQEGQIRVFHNVCSHRGNELVWEASNTGTRIRCRYHSWTYDLDGTLRGTPHVGGTGIHEVEGFCKQDHGLRKVRSATWMGLVFINLSGEAPQFTSFIEPLQQRVDALASPEQLAQLQPAASHGATTIEFRGNWKLCLENNLEAYHLPWVHPDLNAISRLEDHYDYDGGDLFAGQGSTAYDHKRGFDPVFPEYETWPQGVSEYPTLYPNVFLGLHCDHYWTRIVEPVAPDKTYDHVQLYYLGDAQGEDFEAMRSRRLDTWLQVFQEDIGVVEGMQRGRASSAFTGGVFTPVMDQPSLHFAKWMVNRIQAAGN